MNLLLTVPAQRRSSLYTYTEKLVLNGTQAERKRVFFGKILRSEDPDFKYVYETETVCKGKKIGPLCVRYKQVPVFINDTAGSMAGPEYLCLECDEF